MTPDVGSPGPVMESARAHPGKIQTNNITRNPRYSYLETPREMQASTFHQFSSPTNSVIDESPISPRDGYTTTTHESVARAQIPAGYAPERTMSPYGFPAPQEVHPAYFAPYSEESSTQKEQLQPHNEANPPSKPDVAQNPENPQSPVKGPDTPVDRKVQQPQVPYLLSSRTTNYYAPDSLGGPSGHENHRPGQVAHPNSMVDPHWKHGLCEPDATCCLSLLCPCMVYGKTQYRLSRKAQKQDPTDLLGYESCNGSCGFMAIACGFQWALATIQRTRIRKLYKLEGSVGSDCTQSLCCCCCVLARNESEVREREEFMRRNAGPANGAYIAPGPMAYAPPPK